MGKPFETLVPKPDADGLDQGGIALPELLVPLGTRTGFNTRNDAAGFPWATGRWDGSFVPFPRTDIKRQASGDQRPSLQARYANRAAYEAKVRSAAAAIVALGFLLPDYFLGNRVSARQFKIKLALPEALDLLVICIEAGLGLDQAILRVADELQLSQPELTDEFNLLNLEQRAGRPRTEAWKNLADRTDVDSVRGLVTMLTQADHFGTSIAKSLRVHSDVLRIRRRQEAEEQAAKTTVKLVFPLVFFIFPSLFVVVLAPSMIKMKDAFQQYLLN